MLYLWFVSYTVVIAWERVEGTQLDPTRAQLLSSISYHYISSADSTDMGYIILTEKAAYISPHKGYPI